MEDLSPVPHCSFLCQTSDMAPEVQPGMREVPAWLKSLRLHKYTSLFMKMSYNQMLSLTDEQLIELKVTQGARRKILHCIEKLKRRGDVLRAVQMNLLEENRCVRCAIGTLRQILSTPIHGYYPFFASNFSSTENENLPELIMLILCRVFALVFGRNPVTDITNDYVLMMYAILEKISLNEEFTESQKARVAHMRKQLRKRVSIQELRRFNLTLPPLGKCSSCQRQESVMMNYLKLLQDQQCDQQLMQMINSMAVEQKNSDRLEYCPHRCPRDFKHSQNTKHGTELSSATLASYPQYRSNRAATEAVPQPVSPYIWESLTFSQAKPVSVIGDAFNTAQIWEPVRRNKSCDSSSGYSSSSSERSSGAGSPRSGTINFDQSLVDMFSSQMTFGPLNGWSN